MNKILLLFLIMFTSFSAFSADLTNLYVFEKTCLTSGKSCGVTAIHAISAEEVRDREIRYLNSVSRDDLIRVFSAINYPKLKMYIMASSAALRGSQDWKYLPDKSAVIREASSMDAGEALVVKLSWLRTISAPPSDSIVFGEDFRAKPDEIRRILVWGAKQAPLYAEWIDKNFHHYATTSSTPNGIFGFEISGWDKTYDGSFYTVTTVPSWKSDANKYMNQSIKMDDYNKLPSFKGTDEQKITSTVKWMASKFKYSDIHGNGAYPNQPVSEIIRSGIGDCKALDLVFRSVLKNSGVEAHPSSVSYRGMPPQSYILPEANWPDHVITYIPGIGKYVDMTLAIKYPGSWRNSAQELIGATTLDLRTGRFAVVGVTREL